jgi:hypothetical protein
MQPEACLDISLGRKRRLENAFAEWRQSPPNGRERAPHSPGRDRDNSFKSPDAMSSGSTTVAGLNNSVLDDVDSASKPRPEHRDSTVRLTRHRNEVGPWGIDVPEQTKGALCHSELAARPSSQA